LPTNAKKYIEYIENWLEKPFRYISVGPRREEIILK
jgi:adenylosuccinate synthase